MDENIIVSFRVFWSGGRLTSHINFSVWRATVQIELIRIQISPSICAEVLLEQVKRNDHRILGSGRQTDAIVAGILEHRVGQPDQFPVYGGIVVDAVQVEINQVYPWQLTVGVK